MRAGWAFARQPWGWAAWRCWQGGSHDSTCRTAASDALRAGAGLPALSLSGRGGVEVSGTARVAGSVRGGGGTTTGASRHLHVLAEALELITLVSSGAVNLSGKVAATYYSPQCAVAQRRELCRDITGSRARRCRCCARLPGDDPPPWTRSRTTLSPSASCLEIGIRATDKTFKEYEQAQQQAHHEGC